MTPEQLAHRDRIVSKFTRAFREKYKAGQLAHGGNLWEKPGMIDAALEEAQDLVCYLYTLQEQQARVPIDDLPPVAYIAGPFRAKTPWDIEQNIRRAEALALDVWRLGCACLCPHTNTRFFDGSGDDEIWLKGDLSMLARCDVVLMTDDWERSTGATAERAIAIARGVPVVYSLSELGVWLGQRAAVPVLA